MKTEQFHKIVDLTATWSKEVFAIASGSATVVVAATGGNAERLADLKASGFPKANNADLLLRLFDKDGNRRSLRRADEYRAAAKAAGVKNPGALGANGFVDRSADDETRHISEKGVTFLKDLGFEVK